MLYYKCYKLISAWDFVFARIHGILLQKGEFPGQSWALGTYGAV